MLLPAASPSERVKCTLNLTDPGFARWRVWAADVRDGKGPHADNGALLCRLLDIYEATTKRAALPNAAGNLIDGQRLAVESLIGRILAEGAAPPDTGAVLK